MVEISAKIKTMIDGVIEREGGFVDHKDDPGGATRWGITEAVARANGYRGEMRSLGKDTAFNIYHRQYVVEPGFSAVAKLSPLIADELIDTGVNAGTRRAGEFLQRALNISNSKGREYPDLVVDGKVGPATLGALRTYLAGVGHREAIMIKLLDGYQARHYINLAERSGRFESFIRGWFAHRIGNAA